MQVIRAEAMGMCFGVKDAISATESIMDPANVTIHGELVHNEVVNRRLRERGFAGQSEVGRQIPSTARVIITAHGISNRESATLQAAGKILIDTTCPLVRRAHDTATRLADDGWHVVIAGKRGHVEVMGLSGDLDSYTILETPEEATALPYDKIGIICQTTLQPQVADSITLALRASNPEKEVRLFNTICRPTRDRQQAMHDLLPRCEAVVVVGGIHSNNTRQLVKLAESAGKPVCQVQTSNQLDETWVSKFQVIGLTAGTSTPDSTINEVHKHLQQIAGRKNANERQETHHEF